MKFVAALASWLLYACATRPSRYEYTLASFQTPLLQILVPTNGEVLASSEVSIEIAVRDEIMPAPFHNSKVCVGMNADSPPDVAARTEFESCFDQMNNTVFHANGLHPGTSYAVRVLLIDRGNVIAISMRHFRVAAISIEGHDVTVSMALQHALALHQNGDTENAAGIYYRILAETPNHGHTLHLLGLVLFQSGRTDEAIPLIEQALRGNSTFEEFHNSMGLCLKELGRFDDAVASFETAIRLRPSFLEARFNFATLLQAMGNYTQSILALAPLAQLIQRHEADVLHPTVQHDVFKRLLELYHGIERFDLALERVDDAIALWPMDATFRNERGNLYLRMDHVDAARSDYAVAAQSGMFMNAVIVVEAVGDIETALEEYDRLLTATAAQNLPQGQVLVMQAGVLPRILPRSDALLDRYRDEMDARLDALIARTVNFTDSMDPVLGGYPTGFPLFSHNRNNKSLRQKLARLYELYCPATNTAEYIVPKPKIVLPSRAIATTPRPWVVDVPRKRPRVGFVSKFFETVPTGPLTHDLIVQLDPAQFEIFVFAVSPTVETPELVAFARDMEHLIVLPNDLSACAQEIKRHNLDVLIYPELGGDKLTYFLAYTKLATVQAVWYDHADTTGIPAIDYFVTSEFEAPGFQAHYSEEVFPLQGMGIYTTATPVDPHVTIDQVRTSVARDFNVPVSMHFYLIVDPIANLHPDMDEVMTLIFDRDPNAHIFFLAHSSASELRDRFVDRLVREPGMAQHVKRVHYFLDVDEPRTFLLIQSCDVLLMGLYANKLQPALLALSVGTPYVTLPRDVWRTRIPYGFLKQMNVLDGVVASVVEYADVAVRLVVDKPFREDVVTRLRSNRDKIFQDADAVAEWTRFLHVAVDEATRRVDETVMALLTS
ncbi:Aste57867_19443 [Aphanomyces stellatus]|uniref:protein O-GlcNAc transferase n=1 Tax=Aphanomyces stellatus TaxID=120398 RepID=A0A485LEI6_9STRA|nr:hypothetical protein As57867_019379 [Aphanomyces stellatus]VFT96156.1 Aste57867_19443 [Aphanomyces stellatus]